MRGSLVLVGAMWLSSYLELTATTFLLNRVVEWAIVVLVVLFQPELRRFLERVGSSRFGMVFASNKESAAEMETAILETTEAYTSLSKDKVGALMVFERQNLLDEVIKTGTQLDCAVSSELLKNIFWNKAPLHDGAVIIRAGKICAAGCHCGNRLGGDRFHFCRGGGQAQAPSGTGDAGAASAKRTDRRKSAGKEDNADPSDQHDPGIG